MPNQNLKTLEKKLLKIGGKRVCLREEPDIERLVASGCEVTARVKKRAMETGDCHGNAARAWAENPKRYRIMTGWALSRDGIWRQHSWVMDGQVILETTEKRISYWGIALSGRDAIAFWASNSKYEPESWPKWLQAATVEFFKSGKPHAEIFPFLASRINE